MNAQQQGLFERIKYILFPFLHWTPMLNRKTVGIDVVAGITAGVLILPQAIALATVAGMPPEYGLYTSIFPVIIASLYGSSWHALSGPNTALAVLMAMTIAPFANIATPDYIQYAITLTFMAGVLQLALGALRLGVIFNYFSHTVMIALVTAVGIIIVLQQVGNYMGVVMNPNEDLDDLILQIFIMVQHANWYAVAVGTITVVSGVMIKKLKPKWPHYIMAVIIGMIAAWMMNMQFGAANTQIDMLGYMSISALPLSAPDFSPQNFAEFSTMAYPAAMGMAILGLMQTSVIARSMAAKSGQAVDMNQEVVGQGLSNIGGSFLSCFTSCGSFNRSAANIESGARTPLAGFISAFALAGLIYVAAPLIAYMPVAVMAGVLFLVGAALVKMKDIKAIMSVRGETRVVFVLVFATTLFSGVDDGVYLGVFLSIVGYLRAVSRPEVEVIVSEEKEQYLLDGMTEDNTSAMTISGSLFFGSTQNLETMLTDISRGDKRHKHLIVLGEYIDNIDESAVSVFATEAKKREANGYRLVLWVRDSALCKDETVSEKLLASLGAENVICGGRAKSETLAAQSA